MESKVNHSELSAHPAPQKGKLLDVRKVILEKNPKFLSSMPSFLSNFIIAFIEKLIHVKEFNEFFSLYGDKESFDLIDQVFEYLEFSYSVLSRDKDRIPSEGRLICISNHPLGGLDGLAILKVIHEIRSDVKIVVNDVLMNLKGLAPLFIPHDNINEVSKKTDVRRIGDMLQNEGVVVFFPASEVSRLTLKGVRDRSWHRGALYFSKKYNAPILPIFVHAYNSLFFYLFSVFFKNLSMFLLPHEVFNKRSKHINIKIGNLIPVKSFEDMKQKTALSLLRKHVYSLGGDRMEVLKTVTNIVHPVGVKNLKKEFTEDKLLTETRDGKKVYLIDYESSPNIIREIGRLREITFRKVGEGTGKRIDLDPYDKYYKHLVLWDDMDLEIVGAYRLGIGSEIKEKFGLAGLYTSELFEFHEDFNKYMDRSVELGRSFIQSRYWNSNALDNLWSGIGAFLVKNPHITNFFGGVSISSVYPQEVRDIIVFLYMKWFGDNSGLIKAKNPYTFTDRRKEELSSLFIGSTYKDDYLILKNQIRGYGFSIPTLYRQYTELVELDGVKFFDFCVDRNFYNCIDGMIMLDLTKTVKHKRERYLGKGAVISRENENQADNCR